MKHYVSEVYLKNGARGLLIDVPDATVMEMEFQFRAGHRLTASPKIYQAAHIMEHLSFGANRDFANERDFTSEFAKNGAYHNAYTSDFHMGYIVSCADFEWERILKLQQLAICHPVFSQDQLESEKGNIHNELSGMLSRDEVLLWPRLEIALGGKTMTMEDQIKTIDNVSLKDVIEHHQRTHTINNMRFIIAGKITGRRTKIKKLLESWDLPKGERLDIPCDAYTSSGPVRVNRSDAKSLTYAFSIVLPRTLSEAEQHALRALNHILTGTLYSRIFGKARERGLTYTMYSGATLGLYDSSWEFNGKVLPEAADDLFDLIAEELKTIMDKGVTDEEIVSTASYRLGAYQMSLQTVSEVSSFYARTYFLNDTITNYKQIPDMLQAVSKRRINKLLREFLNQGCWVFGAVGDVRMSLIKRNNEKLKEVLRG